MKKIIFLIISIFLFIQLAFAAHYIVGNVNDALNSEPANGKKIVVWNPLNGISDNQTDTIGPTGNSGANNIYMIDCELLSTPCNVGDILNIRLLDTIKNYVAEEGSVTVTGAGFDIVDNITINSPPSTTLQTPVDKTNFSTDVTFNCSYFDYDLNADNLTLWGNWSGTWEENETKSISTQNSFLTFTKSLTEGSYKWACYVEDNLSTGNFSNTNRTFTVDLTDPIIDSMQINKSETCSEQFVRVNCTTYDELLEIDTVLIESISPTLIRTNHSAQFLVSNTYYSDIYINEAGTWSFNCISNDTANNIKYSTINNFLSSPAQAELFLDNSNIFFNITPSVENQLINITANITNLGCSDANNLLIGLFEGNKSQGGTSIENKSVLIPQKSSKNISFNWPTKIGLINIFIYSDLNNSFSEDNETNNDGNKTSYLQAWQEIYGNTTVNKLLASLTANMTLWENETQLQGNIFITDSEAIIDWNNLKAIGKNTIDENSSNDFSEIDSILQMTTLNDSISNLFTNSQVPITLENLSLFQTTIENIPIINSTNSSNFTTGLLWDTSDDSNGEYDSTEKEDIVLIAKVNKQSQGFYGKYDYEIRVPSKLRQYNTADQNTIYFYYELN